jgi:hypothetical protein
MAGLTDVQRRLAMCLSETGSILIIEDDNGTSPHYRSEKVHNKKSELVSGSMESAVRALARKVDPYTIGPKYF